MVDLSKYKGSAPYASQLFGVYQPLIGWRAERSRARLRRERSGRLKVLTAMMMRDAQFTSVAVTGGARTAAAAKGRFGNLLSPVVAEMLSTAAQEFETAQGRPPQAADWSGIVATAKLGERIGSLESKFAKEANGARPALVRKGSVRYNTVDKTRTIGITGTELVIAPKSLAAADKVDDDDDLTLDFNTEHASAAVATYLASSAGHVLSDVLGKASKWRKLIHFVDPLSQFDPDTQDAVLSPIGIVQLYRQHFFEVDSFLGPSIGHVWVSPGTTLELMEVHQRRGLFERKTEYSQQSVQKREAAVEAEDELSSRMSEENSRDLSLGISANAGVNFGVFHADASVNFGYQSSHRTSQEVSHTQTRRQSEKVASELKRDFKTSFRTVLETTDRSSRHYKIENTGTQLINYELRRKMRRVVVQLQHIGTQLCWQVYLDEPGSRLGIAELVHIAKQDDLSGAIQPPEAPQPLEAKESEITFDFPFEVNGADPDRDEFFKNGTNPDDHEEKIIYKKTVRANPPGPGYTLAFVNQRDVLPVDPEEDAAGPVVAAFTLVEGTTDSFEIKLKQVNFNDQPAIRFLLDLTWNPPGNEAALKAFEEQWTEYEEKRARAEHEEYVRAVRERVKLASQVLPRAEDDLRAEERSAIFERLIEQLTGGAGDEQPHVTVELIRSLFDVEKMLYFVSNSWWRPRKHHGQQGLSMNATRSLTEHDIVGWGGVQSRGRDNYLITEESEPATLGASLGWMLQLDGDPHRNAFLNSPFVKAVVPIRPGREKAALEWLKRAHVEGAEGLNTPYRGTEPLLQGKTLEQAVMALAQDVQGLHSKATLQSEEVFENGFDPLEGGFRYDEEALTVFDQWLEVVPTDQIVAVDYPTPVPA